jgi:hypothetical protein
MYCVFTPRVRRVVGVGRYQAIMSPSLRSSQIAVFLHHTIVTRSSRLTMRSSTLFRRAGLALVSLGLFIHSATAQDWSITSNCNSTGNGGGRFTDSLGAIWEVKCASELTGYSFMDQATQGQGIYGCFKDCDNRPQCTGFSFAGSVTSEQLSYFSAMVNTSLTSLQIPLLALAYATSGQIVASSKQILRDTLPHVWSPPGEPCNVPYVLQTNRTRCRC